METGCFRFLKALCFCFGFFRFLDIDRVAGAFECALVGYAERRVIELLFRLDLDRFFTVNNTIGPIAYVVIQHGQSQVREYKVLVDCQSLFQLGNCLFVFALVTKLGCFRFQF